MSVIADPRLVDAKAPTPQDVARSTRGNLGRLGQAVIAVIRNVFPTDMNITLIATQYNGKWKVEFKPPAIKEAGYRD